MKPIGFKERKNLFLQYFILFSLTAGLLLGSLFFTQETNNDEIGVNEKSYNEFASFYKNKNEINNLIDTVTAEANKIRTQNSNGSFSIQTAHGLINDFSKDRNIDVSNNLLIKNITELLQFYVNANKEIKAADFQQDQLKRLIQECEKNYNDLKDQKLIKASEAPSQ